MFQLALDLVQIVKKTWEKYNAKLIGIITKPIQYAKCSSIIIYLSCAQLTTLNFHCSCHEFYYSFLLCSPTYKIDVWWVFEAWIITFSSYHLKHVFNSFWELFERLWLAMVLDFVYLNYSHNLEVASIQKQLVLLVQTS